MKKKLNIIVLIVVFSIGLLTITGCKKEEKIETEINKEEQFDAKIVGSWKKSTNNGSITYILRKNKTGTYTNRDDQTNEIKEFIYDTDSGIISITFEDGKLVQYPYSIREDKLVLVNIFGEETYHKIAE